MKAKAGVHAGVAGGGWGKNGAGDSMREVHVRMDNTGLVCELEKCGFLDCELF